MGKMVISSSIVLYKNNETVLKAAISSFLKITFPDVILYLIDNSPIDELKDISDDSRVIYIHNPSNPGFGAGHNIALKLAIQQGATYHLILNPDVYYAEGVLEELTDYLEKNMDIGNIMPKVLYPNNEIQRLCKLLPTPYDWIGRRFNPFKKMVEKRNDLFELRFTGYDRIMDVPYLSGCFMYLRISALNEIGLFDEGIFMYGEETDLCRRLIDAGYRTVFYPRVHIYHHFEKGSHKSWRLTKIGMESAIYYFNKWGWFFDRKRRLINKDILRKINSQK
ncbi:MULTISPECIES: glycosyltransferase family 2 protein [Sphingobacterium]|jgi:GT2 family glycosyltransferase|uniref:glycosyltransferase family 2 protein n=1 Tax=Sphingobacterium TaxID=28453 RepID=UPI00257E39D2|nr:MULTISPECIES: glycosyltransferase family 2 protein [Sphingobacterium]